MCCKSCTSSYGKSSFLLERQNITPKKNGSERHFPRVHEGDQQQLGSPNSVVAWFDLMKKCLKLPQDFTIFSRKKIWWIMVI